VPAGRREYAELLDFGSKITVHAASQGRAPGRSHDTRMVPNPEDLPIRSREPPLDFLRFPAKVAHQNPTFVSEIPQEKTVSIWLRKGNPTGISRRQSLWVILDLLSVRGPASFFQVWALFEPKIGEIFGISPTGSNSF
jgi:hypothetical protein